MSLMLRAAIVGGLGYVLVRALRQRSQQTANAQSMTREDSESETPASSVWPTGSTQAEATSAEPKV
jgi:hypothetical protein